MPANPKPVNREGTGLIHLYAGDGKGKTSACIGLAVRAVCSGLRVWFVQFLKSGRSAELDGLRQLGVNVISGAASNKFSFAMNQDERVASRDYNDERLRYAWKAAAAGEMDVLILDEALGSIQADLLSEETVLELIRQKPDALELVLSGRNPSPELIEQADYYSEICMRKHPYVTYGQSARRGIEF